MVVPPPINASHSSYKNIVSIIFYNIPTYQPGLVARLYLFTGHPIGPQYAFVIPQIPNTQHYNSYVPSGPDKGIIIHVKIADDKKKKKNEESSSDDECKKCEYERRKTKYIHCNVDKFWKNLHLAMDSRHISGKIG